MKTAGIALAVVVSTAAMATAQQKQVSLGDLSRQIEAERASGSKSKKSLSNKDLDAAPIDQASPEQAPAEGYVSASTGEKVSPDELLKRSQEKVDAGSGAALPESHWRQRADYLRTEFGRAQQRLNKLKELPQPAALPARARLENEFAMVRQMVSGLNKQWDRLEESARVARVPPDWIGARPVFEQ